MSSPAKLPKRRNSENSTTEQVLLGSVMLEAKLMAEVAEANLKESDFTDYRHAIVYRTLMNLHRDGSPLDSVAVSAKMVSDGQLDYCGGVSFLMTLTDGVPVRKTVSHLIEEIRELSQLRTLRKMFTQASESIDKAGLTASQIGSDMVRLVEEVVGEGKIDRTAFFVNAFDVLVKQQSELAKRSKDETLGLCTGLPPYDKLTKGFFPGEYTLIAGYTADGKSSLAVQAALANATQGVPVHIFSVEMGKELMTMRFLPMVTGIPFWKCRDWRYLSPDEKQQILNVRPILDGLPVLIDDTGGIEIDELVSRAKASRRKYGVELLIVDYIQLVKARGTQSRLDRVNAVSEALRELAKSQKMHVIALSQLARPEGRKKERPTLFHLKESGQLEQDAYMVSFVYRPQDGSGNYTYEDELIIGKNRSGPIQSIPVLYNTELLCYEERK